MSKINYVTGDATYPQGEGTKVICHITNDLGAWGAGFVLAISRRWKEPEQVYRGLKQRNLGDISIVPVTFDTTVCNMIAQHGISDSIVTGIKDTDPFRVIVPPIRYDALRDCLKLANSFCELKKASIHMPRIGCGLAGATWDKIEPIINECITVPVTVYDLPIKTL
jgi:O-acetyl-ADP-ribose deacetylase (regulator of RNase III)